MIVAVHEARDGTRLVEVHMDPETKLYSFKFPQDAPDGVIFERLAGLKTAVEDAIWNKGRYVPIPEDNAEKSL